MAVLETLRGKIFGGVITVLIALSLLSFIVDFNSLSSAVNSMLSKYAVGEIDGQKISYKDFQERVEYQTAIAEILNGSSVSTDEQQKQIRDAAWQYFVDQNLFLKNAKAAGLEVGGSEMADLSSGSMVSPIIAGNMMFCDADGSFNREKLTEFLGSMSDDQTGNSRMYWNYLEDMIMNQQFYAKYGSLFTAANMPNKLTLQNTIQDNNTTLTIESVMVDIPYEKDSTITVSPAEIKSYYKAHKSFYRQPASRDIKYALFEVVPSEADIDAARKSIEDVYEEFAATDNAKNFIMRNSEQSWNERYYKAGELNTVNSEVNDFVFANESGVSSVIKSGNDYYAARIIETKALPDSVFVRHILIQNNDSLADSLMTVLKSGKTPFSQLAAAYSVDQNPNVENPGDIGWMTQDYMIPGMESVISSKIGEPFILNTAYGRHIVEVTRKTAPIQKKKVAILKKSAIPSKATINEWYNKANTLATAASGSLEKLQNAAKEQNVYLYTMNVTDATARYNSVDRAKEVTRWAFEADKGTASNVITVNQNYLFVVGVEGTHKEGYSKVEEVSSRIESILYRQKVADKIAAEVAGKIKDCTDITAAAKALGKTPVTSENVSLSVLNSRDNEPAVLGAASVAEAGKLYGPVKGSMGIYVLQVKDRETASHYTEDDARQYENQKNQYAVNLILPAMLESSESVDHREKFY